MSERKYLVGIDPGLETTGVALYDPKTNSLELFTGDIQQAVNWMGRNCKPAECLAVIEDPNANSLVYGGWDDFVNMGKNRSAFSRMMKKAQQVGEVKAAAKVLIKIMGRSGYQIATIAPSQRQSAKKVPGTDVRLLRMPTKTTPTEFAKLTGYGMQSSEHSRDAATLVWGKSVKQIELMILKKVTK